MGGGDLVLQDVPEPVEDYIRNFLLRQGMTSTLQSFQNEWFRKIKAGEASRPSGDVMPDLYRQLDELQAEVTRMATQLSSQGKQTMSSQSKVDKLQKERDYHRMCHRRILQEKGKLVTEITRLKDNLVALTNDLQITSDKHQALLREKALIKLDRDRTRTEVTSLHATLRQANIASPAPPHPALATGVASIRKARHTLKSQAMSTMQRPAALQTQFINTTQDTPMRALVDPSHLLPPDGIQVLTPARAKALSVVNTISAHDRAVTALALHPNGEAFATVGDDGMLKLWNLPGAQPKLEIQAHAEWIADVRYSPDAAVLATASGDGSVRLWDAETGDRVAAYTEHAHAVWSVDFHHSGDFIATGSLDNTIKVWDLNTGQCRHTLRQHHDSVNCVRFQPGSNQLLSASADCTVILWDARTGLPVHTFKRHKNAVTALAFSHAGDVAISCDADGLVVLWELQSGQALLEVDLGPHSAASCSMDTSGAAIAVGSSDSAVRLIDIATKSVVATLKAHDDGVQAVAFDHVGGFLLSAGADDTVRVWS